MSEEQVEIGRPRQGLAGVLHRPGGAPAGAGVVFCPGFPKSKAESDFGFVLAARRAARRLAVLRFDYRGLGDSPGSSWEVTLTGMVADACRALGWLSLALAGEPGPRARPTPRLGLLGFGLGAAVAARAAAASRPAVAALVLWSPSFVPLPDYRRLLLPAGLRALDRDGRVDMADLAEWEADESPSRDYFLRLGAEPKNARGLAVGRRLLEELRGLETLGPARALGLPVLAVVGSEASPLLGRPPGGGEGEGEGFHLYVVQGANHLFTRPRWKEEAIEATAAFFEASLGVQ